MTTKPDPDKSRHVYGPRGLSAILPALVRPALRKRAPTVAALLADWEMVMGPALAAVTTPRKLFQGTLAIACSGPIAMELQHLAPTLIGRINAHLGQTAVTRLRFVPETQQAPPTPQPVPNTRAATAVLTDMPAGKLRDALLGLGAAVLSTSPRPRR